MTMNETEQEQARKILNCEHAEGADDGLCVDCGGDMGPCVWFEGIGDTSGRECPEPVVTRVRMDIRDEVTDDSVDEIILWLCRKHGKRLAFEAAHITVPENLLDDYEIQEHP